MLTTHFISQLNNSSFVSHWVLDEFYYQI